MSDSLAWPCDTPRSAADRLSITPRSDGSAARAPRNGCALNNCWVVVSTSFTEQEQQAIVIEERAAIGTAHIAEQGFIPARGGR